MYNESHIRTRNTVERQIGVWKRRFPILAYGCRLKIDTVLEIIVATAVLYNICKENNEQDPPDPEDLARFLQVMVEDDVPIIPPQRQGIEIAGHGITMQSALINDYFSNLVV